MPLRRVLLIFSLLIPSYVFGALSYKWSLPPLKQYVELRNLWSHGVYDVDVAHIAFADPTGREAVDCGALVAKDTAVLLAAGQSNGANHSAGHEAVRAARGEVYNFWQGRCYRAVEPLLGADGTGTNVWLRVGEQLIKSGAYRRVILATTARDGAAIADLMPGGGNFRRIETALDGLLAVGLPPTAFLWFQGESDVDTPAEQYTSGFRAILNELRSRGMTAPAIVSTTTVCRNLGSKQLREAQRALADVADHIFIGPDTDTLDNNHRYDGCHLNEIGKSAAANMWAQIIARTATALSATAESVPTDNGPR